MNERIKELAEQCWEERKYGPTWFNQEKFAELIIEECASICYNSHIEYGDVHAQNILYEFNINNCRNDK